MKHKVSELSGALLDAAVAMAEGKNARVRLSGALDVDSECIVGVWDNEALWEVFAPSRWWDHGGPIIERERIRLLPQHEGTWAAHTPLRPVQSERDAPCWGGYGLTPLIAAMRAYVASKFGEEVELP